MTYRHDDDLSFLGDLASHDLNDLVYLLTHYDHQRIRVTEELTKSHAFQHFFPDHHRYWEDIAAEIQCFGANTFATFARRGKGIS